MSIDLDAILQCINGYNHRIQANLDAILQCINECNHRIQANPNSDGWIRLIDLLRKAQNDKRIQSSTGASDFLDLMIELASDSLTFSTADLAVQPLIDVSPEAVFAKPFLKHAGSERKPGPVKAFIRASLEKKPDAKNEELWDAIMARPPKGWKAMETIRLGRYLEGPKPSDEVKWKSFCTYAWSERKRLKIHS